MTSSDDDVAKLIVFLSFKITGMAPSWYERVMSRRARAGYCGGTEMHDFYACARLNLLQIHERPRQRVGVSLAGRMLTALVESLLRKGSLWQRFRASIRRFPPVEVKVR